nr:MAG TPA: hypothetical protein [Caudoviricetes sp.]
MSGSLPRPRTSGTGQNTPHGQRPGPPYRRL